MTTPQTHGLDGTLVPPDWPALTLAELDALLANFPAHAGPIQILSRSPRPFSAASVVSTPAGRIFVKRHHRTVRDREALLEEHRFLTHLHAKGAPVPRILADRSGQTAFQLGDSTYELHEAPSATDLYGQAVSWTPFRTAAHARSAGQALARLHLASQGFNAPARQPRPLVASFSIFAAPDPYAAMERYLAARPALAASPAVRVAAKLAVQLLLPFHAQLQPLLSDLAPLWTHNDFHASNLLWTGSAADARAACIIDFGLADRTNAVHDIAHAIERNIVEWLALVRHPNLPNEVPVHLNHLHALLDGYESIRPLTAAEAAALVPMTALCHAEFALSEADYFLGILHSPAQARMAWDGYLLGHARWFRSAGSHRLLEALRAWAGSRQGASQKVGSR